MRPPVLCAFALIGWSVALIGPTVAQAQAVRGKVTGASGATRPGVLVMLLDSTGTEVARDLTDADGEYLVAFMQPGQFQLRVARIGFRPVTTTPFRLARGETVRREPIIFSGLAVSLDTVTVVGRRSCDTRSAQQGGARELWDQARTALRIAELTAQRRPFEASLLVFERRLDPGNGVVRAESSRPQRAVAMQPWASLPIARLREIGYVVRRADGSAVYHAPGLDALASDEFIADHCFRVERSERDKVAIRFEPTRERRNVPEIAGTAWLDRATTALQRIDIRYVNISREEQAGAGAALEFLQLARGNWLISRWEIRMPVLRPEYIVTSGRAVARVTRMVAHEIRAEGGELTVVTRGADTLWASPHLFLTGLVVDSASGQPVAGARVRVAGTTFHGGTDGSGYFRIANVPSGEYTLRVTTDSLSLLNDSVEVRISPETRAEPVRIRLPSPAEIASGRCPETGGGSAGGGIMGRLGGGDEAMSNAEMFFSWGESSGGKAGSSSGRRSLRPARGGFFTICGLPLSDVTVEAVSDSASARGIRIQLSDARPLAIVEVVMQRRAEGGVIMGTIISAVDGRPVPDVEVSIAGTSLRAFTDSAGRVRFMDAPVGEHVLEARRVGFRSASLAVAVDAGKRISRAIVLAPIAVLPSVQVEASTSLADFDEHRRLGLGTFITRADIAKANGAPLSTLLREIPAILVIGSRTASVASKRPLSLSSTVSKCPEEFEKRLGYKCACYAQVYLDGHVMYNDPEDPFFDVNSIPPESVEAIEYYAGPAQTPAKYSRLNSACGVLVIHTRQYVPPKKSPTG